MKKLDFEELDLLITVGGYAVIAAVLVCVIATVNGYQTLGFFAGLTAFFLALALAYELRVG